MIALSQDAESRHRKVLIDIDRRTTSGKWDDRAEVADRSADKSAANAISRSVLQPIFGAALDWNLAFSKKVIEHTPKAGSNLATFVVLTSICSGTE